MIQWRLKQKEPETFSKMKEFTVYTVGTIMKADKNVLESVQ